MMINNLTKFVLLLFLLFIVCGHLLASKEIIVTMGNERSFSCQMLYASDSLLYIWVGLDEFNIEDTLRIVAMPFNLISSLDLHQPLSWKDGIIRILPATALAGAIIVGSNFTDQPASNGFMFFGIFNLMFALPAGGLVSLLSQYSKIVEEPQANDFNLENGKYRKYLLLKQKDQEIIDRLLKEGKP